MLVLLRNTLVLIMLLCGRPSLAQEPLTGTVDYPQLGISFTVPEGWEANEGDGLVFLGSRTTSGLILMSIHDLRTEEDLSASLIQGFSEDGIELFAKGRTYAIGDGVLSIEHTGKIEGEPARGLGIGMLNPYGDGVSIVALALEKAYTPALTNAAMDLMESVVFRKLENTGPSAEHWKRHFTHARLTRIESYASPTAVEGMAGGGYVSEQRIDLCDDHFKYSSNSQANVEGDGVPDNSGGNSTSEGEWDVLEGPGGKPILRLDHGDGHRDEFMLEERDGKVYLNSERWLRTVGGKYAADCE